MAKTRSMTRNQQKHDAEASSGRKRLKSCAPWPDLDHNLLFLVMMQLGVVDFLSFRGVCKSWRTFGCENQNKFMASMPPMHMTICGDADEKKCHLKDFEGRKFTTILSSIAGGACVGLTYGYLIFFTRETRDLWLVNPITRKELYFHDFPMDYNPGSLGRRAILVFSPAISGLVFVVLYKNKIWFSIAGKGTWNHVSVTFHIYDVYAFKGKVYTLSYSGSYPLHEAFHVRELRLNPEPKLTLLEIKKSGVLFPLMFVSSRENIYVMDGSRDPLNSLLELDLGEMKWLALCEKTMGKYAFFRSNFKNAAAVKRESWADPRSHERYADFQNPGKIRFFNTKMWYFPHECMDVGRIDE